MTEMVEWLRGQIESDKAAAEAAEPRPWRHSPTARPAGWVYVESGPDAVHEVARVRIAGNAAHIATHDPRDTIARCEAELEIIDEHALMHRDIGYLDGEREETYEELEVCARCVAKHSHYASRADVPTGPCRTVRLLISGYRHRPGWKEGWKP